MKIDYDELKITVNELDKFIPEYKLLLEHFGIQPVQKLIE